jgi:hypothetical protein
MHAKRLQGADIPVEDQWFVRMAKHPAFGNSSGFMSYQRTDLPFDS